MQRWHFILDDKAIYARKSLLDTAVSAVGAANDAAFLFRAISLP